jgi:hypothetical protein
MALVDNREDLCPDYYTDNWNLGVVVLRQIYDNWT